MPKLDCRSADREVDGVVDQERPLMDDLPALEEAEVGAEDLRRAARIVFHGKAVAADAEFEGKGRFAATLQDV
jgi:type IV secretory pathway protease TraF